MPKTICHFGIIEVERPQEPLPGAFAFLGIGGGYVMGRLVMAKPRLAVAKPRLAKAVLVDEADRSRLRDAVHAWRAWYKTARWQKLRWQVLVKALFTCAMCNRVEGETSKLVADHKVPHRGDEALFWDEGNLQCLCKGCHDSVKQAQERNQGRW